MLSSISNIHASSHIIKVTGRSSPGFIEGHVMQLAEFMHEGYNIEGARTEDAIL